MVRFFFFKSHYLKSKSLSQLIPATCVGPWISTWLSPWWIIVPLWMRICSPWALPSQVLSWPHRVLGSWSHHAVSVAVLTDLFLEANICLNTRVASDVPAIRYLFKKCFSQNMAQILTIQPVLYTIHFISWCANCLPLCPTPSHHITSHHLWNCSALLGCKWVQSFTISELQPQS